MAIRKKSTLLIVLITLLLVLAGCDQMEEEPVEAETPDTGLGVPAEAVLDAQAWVAEQLGVPTEGVQIVSTERREWSDACLGLGGPDEGCAQVVTPGWLVVFSVNDEEYEVRTDETGAVIRSPELGVADSEG